MKCSICKEESDRIFESTVLGKYRIAYFNCKKCGFLQTEEPYWLGEAYEEPINRSDTGILARNIWLSKVTSSMISSFFDPKKRFLDYAGGYGILTRLMRDRGFDYYWNDPFTENLFARGFELEDNLGRFELITAFECLEHLKDPLSDIQRMLTYSDNILFSTEVLPSSIPAPEDWWYYGLEHGQHVSFYQKRTLAFIAEKMGFHLNSHGTVHLFTKKKINSHVYELAVRKSIFGPSRLLGKKLKSRTFLDMEKIRSSSRDDKRQ